MQIMSFIVLAYLQLFGQDIYIVKFMTYKPNFGNSYDYYTAQNNLGYSNASRSYGKLSPKIGVDDHGGYNQVEFMLENERKKFREAKDQFQNDLDSQRKRRIQFENKLIKLKDQFSRREVALSEAEFKINNLLHQNQDLAVENDKLKHELARLEEIYGGKINQLQTQLSMETKNFDETTLQYNQQFDNFKKQGQQYVQQLTFEMDRKIKGLQEKLKITQNAKRELAMENKKLNDFLISNRLQFEEQLRDVKNKSRDQQIKKAQYLTKTYEQKLRLVEDGKEALNRKIQEIARTSQDKDSRIAQMERQFEEQSSKLHQDNIQLQQHVNQLNAILSKVKMELAEKDSLIGRSFNDNDGELKLLRQQLESKKQENNQLQSSVRQLRMAIKDVQAQGQKKRRDLAERCYSLQTEARRYKEQYTRLAEILKSKINSTIDNVSYVKKDK